LQDAANRAFPENCRSQFGPALVKAFEHFCDLRLSSGNVGVRLEVVDRELLRPCTLLVTDWSASLFDGALTPETSGFIDDNAMPPWDAWLALAQVPAAQGPACLLSWIPSWIAERVDFSIRVDAAECMSWLRVESDQRLTLHGWGKSWNA
jgi:hypothetical protein